MGTPGPTPTVTLRDVLAVFEDRGTPAEPLTASEVADELACTRRTAHKKLDTLADQGELRSKKPGARSRVWWRPVDSNGSTGGSTGSIQEVQFQELADQVEEYAIFVLDPDGCVETWNAGAEQIKGYEESEIVGEHLSTFYTAEDRDANRPERNLRAAAELGSVDDEGWRVRKDGSRFWANITLTALTDETGSLSGYVKVTRDMTDRHDRQLQLQREKERFESLVSEVKDYAIFMLDPDGRVQSWNDGAEHIKGYEEEEILGEHFSVFYTDSDREKGVPDRNLHAAEHQGRVEDEGWRLRQDGTRFWANVVITRLTDDAGETRGFAKVTRDMTERREYEQTLKAQRDELDELDRINAVIRDVDQTLVTAETRSEVETGVCDRLANSEPFDAAVIGELSGSTVKARAVAGFDSSAFDRSFEGTKSVVAVEAGVGRQAIADNEPQFFERDPTGDEYDHWSEAATGATPTVAAAIPLTSGDLDFGVLFVYSSDADAFDDRKMDVLFELGKTISDSLTSLRRKERERRLTALHRATRDLVQTEAAEELGDTISSTVVGVLGFRDAHVYRFDTADNSLHPLSSASAVEDTGIQLPVLSGQDDSVVWSCFVEGTTRTLDPDEVDDQLIAGQHPRTELVVPMSEHGVIVAGTGPDGQIDSDDRHLVELVAATAEAAFDRFESEANLRERESILQDQNQRLQRLNQVNTVIRKVDQAIVQATTYQEVLRVVCERLTSTERFQFAWIGELKDGGGALECVSQSGAATDYLDAVSLAGNSSEPAVVAARTGTIQVVENVATDLRAAPWRSEAFSREFQSCLAVPLTYGDITYGVLAVYGDRPGTFGDIEETVFEELGTTIGNALNAVEAKFALLSDTTVEVEFELDKTGDTVLTAIADRTDANVAYEGTIPSADESYRLFFTTAGADPDDVLDAATSLETVTDATIVTDATDRTLFEFTLTNESIFAALARQNVTLAEFTVTGDRAIIRVVLPASADVGDFIDWFIESYPSATFLARREYQGREGPRHRFIGDISEYMTDRQYEVMKTAYISGYFDTPRKSTGSDVAETLDLSQPTVTEHIRAAQRRILDHLFEG